MRTGPWRGGGRAKVACGSNARGKSVPDANAARVVLLGATRGTRPGRRTAPLRVEWNVSKQKGRAPTGCAPHVTSQLISWPPSFFFVAAAAAAAAECQFLRRRLRSPGRGLPAAPRPRPRRRHRRRRGPARLSARPAPPSRRGPRLLAAAARRCPARRWRTRRPPCRWARWSRAAPSAWSTTAGAASSPSGSTVTRRPARPRLLSASERGPPRPPPSWGARPRPAAREGLRERAPRGGLGGRRSGAAPPSARGAGRGRARGLGGGAADSRGWEERAARERRVQAEHRGQAGRGPPGKAEVGVGPALVSSAASTGLQAAGDPQGTRSSAAVFRVGHPLRAAVGDPGEWVKGDRLPFPGC